MIIICLIGWLVGSALLLLGKAGEATADALEKRSKQAKQTNANTAPAPTQTRAEALAEFKRDQASEDIDALKHRRAELLKLAAAAELLNKHAKTEKEQLATAQKMLYYDEQIRKTDKAIARAHFDANH